jgi:hypothetical protein
MERVLAAAGLPPLLGEVTPGAVADAIQDAAEEALARRLEAALWLPEGVGAKGLGPAVEAVISKWRSMENSLEILVEREAEIAVLVKILAAMLQGETGRVLSEKESQILDRILAREKQANGD